MWLCSTLIRAQTKYIAILALGYFAQQLGAHEAVLLLFVFVALKRPILLRLSDVCDTIGVVFGNNG